MYYASANFVVLPVTASLLVVFVGVVYAIKPDIFLDMIIQVTTMLRMGG